MMVHNDSTRVLEGRWSEPEEEEKRIRGYGGRERGRTERGAQEKGKKGANPHGQIEKKGGDGRTKADGRGAGIREQQVVDFSPYW